ncbi:LysR family transcriptional regulator [Kitasatospora sp. NPDC054939]
MPQDELDCFLILAEELHFGRTAERLVLSRSRVSQLVQRMERRVGAPLFTRTSRRVALTALGRQLHDELAPLHRAMAAAVDRARATARGIDGVLHVGFATPLVGDIVLRTAEELRASHPRLVVEVCEIPLADPYGQLRKGEFDVQVVELPVREHDLGHGPTLLEDDRALAVAAGHPLAGRASLTRADLAGVPLITVAGGAAGTVHRRPEADPAADGDGDEYGGGDGVLAGPAVTNMQEALMLVAAGRGALLTAAHTADYYARPGVAYVPFRDAEPIGYGLVWRTDGTTDAVRAFARAAVQVARTRPTA